MSRISLVALIAVALLGVIAGRTVPGTSAQDEAASLEGHPLVGTWMAMTPFGASPETFHTDGSFVAGPPIVEPGENGPRFLGPGIGTWESTGPNSGHATFVQALGDETGAYTGTLTIDAHLEVSEDGQSFTDDSVETTKTIRDAGSNVVQVIQPYAAGDGAIPPVTANRMSPGNAGLPEPTGDAATPDA